jgi:hypothetical protein
LNRAASLTNAIDIYRAAMLLIDWHGGEAVPYAVGRADLGSAVWRAIVTVMEELQWGCGPIDAPNY